MIRGGLIVTLSATLLACSATQRHVEPPPPPPTTTVEPEPAPEPEPTGPVIEEDAAAPEGPACVRGTECASGLACRGASGCTSPWACGAPREQCGPDTVSYCDCDGVTFHALASCPNRAYAHVGPCDEGPLETSLGIPDGDEPIVQRDRTCTSSSECRGGEICWGPPGCGMEWRCERARGCMRGGRTSFCGCDGTTFTAQRHCAGRPYAHAGGCDEAIAQTETTAPPSSRSTPTSTSTSTSTSPSPSTSTSPSPSTSTSTSPAPSRVSTTTAPAPPPPLAPGTCRTNRDCGRGMVCAGGAGCGDPWTCIRRTERCNPDTQYFCDCEGHTFTASMTCPSRPYVHRGSCDIDRAMDLAGAALR